MPSNTQLRINDTLTLIQNDPAIVLAGGIRNAAHTLAQTEVTTHYPRHTPVQQAAYDAFSNQMSMSGVANAGNQQQRRMRRAIYLLWKVIGLNTGSPAYCAPRAANAKLLPAANLRAELEKTILKAAALTAAGVTLVFNELVAHPRRFFDSNIVKMSGSVTGKNKYTGAPSAAPGAYQNVLSFDFSYNAANDRYEIQPNGAGVLHSFQAVSVPAVNWNEVPGRMPPPHPPALPTYAGILGTELAGASYMVTTQFTGCSFCYMSDGTNTYAAHISPGGPGGGITGLQLAQDLSGSNPGVTGGDFANFPPPGGGAAAPAFQVFGKGHGNAAVLTGNAFYPATANSMHLFGVDKGGSWRLYTQSIGAGVIVESRRIF